MPIPNQAVASLRLPGKTAVLSHILPPSPSGQAIILYRLLRELDPKDYCLLSIRDYTSPPSSSSGTDVASSLLPGRYHHLAPEPRWQRFGRGPIRVLREHTNILLGMSLHILWRARGVYRVLKKEQCSGIIACSGDLVDLPAACLAARWARIPFYPYMFDDYETAWVTPLQCLFARRVTPGLVRAAAGVIVPNEFLCRAYQQRYQVDPVVVRNIAEPPGSTRPPADPWPHDPGEVRIVYTGAIYDAHFDAVANLAAALRSDRRSNARLHLVTHFPEHALPQVGIVGPVVVHKPVALADALRLQRSADILFLPLAFRSPYPETVRTSAPGKIGEYLGSGRPILVHAPADSFASWYFKKFECGVVVDRPDPAALAAAVRQIIEDAGLRRHVVENARERAAIDFHPRTGQAALVQLLRKAG